MMRHGIRQFASVIAAPVMSCALLAGIVTEQQTHLTPRDVEPYHARAKEAIDGIPPILDNGEWTGKNNEVPLAAQKLLRPNAILSRTYMSNPSGTFEPRVASLRSEEQ